MHVQVAVVSFRECSLAKQSFQKGLGKSKNAKTKTCVRHVFVPDIMEEITVFVKPARVSLAHGKKKCRKKQQPHTHTHTKLLITYNHQHQQSSIIITTILNITTTRSFVSTVPLIPVRTDLSTGAVWECDFWRILWPVNKGQTKRDRCCSV